MPRYLKFLETLPLPTMGDFIKSPEARANSELSGEFGYYASEPLGESEWVLAGLRHRSDVRRYTAAENKIERKRKASVDLRSITSRPKDLRKSMGHVFNDEMGCSRCGYSWHQHRLDPVECERHETNAPPVKERARED